MNKEEFLKRMHYPKEWLDWGMYPDELFEGQLALYKPGDERGSEHDRNGAFHWWLKRSPTKEQLKKLVALSFLDPDSLMAEDVRGHIANAKNCDNEIRELLKRSASRLA